MRDFRAYLLLSFVGIAVLVMLKGLHHSQILDNVLAHTTRTAWHGGGILGSRKTESSSMLRGNSSLTMALAAYNHYTNTNTPPMPGEFFLKKEDVGKSNTVTNVTEPTRVVLLESSKNHTIDDDLTISEETDIFDKNETMTAI